MSEKKTISSKELFHNIETHLLQDARPSVYLESISQLPVFWQPPFQMLAKLREVEQSPRYHPEGNVWIHTMMVVDEAAERRDKSKDQKVFMWSALLHDIGKEPATKIRKGNITAYNHDRIGAEMVREFFGYFAADPILTEKVSNLVRYHMQILYLSKNNKSDLAAMKKQTDIEEIALLGLCDRLGRKHSDYEAEQKNVRQFLQRVR